MEGLFIVTMIPFCFFMTRKNESSFSLAQISTSKAFQELPVPANLKMKVFCTVYKKHMEKWVMLARHHEWNKKRNMFFLIWVWILQLVIVCISLMRIILLGSSPHWFWVSPLLSQISFGLICVLIWKTTRSEDERFEFFDIASNESPLLWKIY
jgi:glucan phosphoethanolaminetransferase (alkaline phosphatase superfamily)